MRKKKVLILFSVIIAVAAIGFSLSDWNDKTTVVDYINNGGPTNTSVTGNNFTGETDMTPVWAPASNMPAPTRYHGAGVGFSRNDTNWLYCFGGDADGSGGNSNVTSIYNATTNVWSTGAPMPTTLVFYTSATRLGTTAYIVGGIGPGGAFTSMVNEVKRYNIATNTWLSNAANYPVTVADGKAAGYQDSLIYVVGGITGGGTVATNLVHVYNANSNTWRTATPLPVTRCSGAMAISGDTIVYVAGGTGYNLGLTNTVYRGVISQSDRSSITWTTGLNFPGATSHRFDAASWGCQGIIVGPGSASGFGTSNTVYRYSPGANVWTPMPNYAQTTSASFLGTASRTGNIWRLMVASGLILQAPYSIPQANVLTDTLCPAPPSTQRCRNGLNINLLDNSTIMDSVQVALGNACVVTDVNVRIDTMIHTWDADVTFYLRKGTVGVNIVDNVGGSGDNFINTVLDNQAVTPIASGVAPFTGSFIPSNPLTPFNGQLTDGYWKLVATDSAGGDTGYLRAWCVVISYTCPVGGIQTVEIPNYYSLSQNYPNPFNPSTVIKFTMPKGDNVKLVVFDILGREVRTLVNEFRSSGVYEVNFDASALSSGVYFYRVETGDFSATKRMLLVK